MVMITLYERQQKRHRCIEQSVGEGEGGMIWENGRTPVAYVGDANSLFWNFISFPRKPSYSASILH